MDENTQVQDCIYTHQVWIPWKFTVWQVSVFSCTLCSTDSYFPQQLKLITLRLLTRCFFFYILCNAIVHNTVLKINNTLTIPILVKSLLLIVLSLSSELVLNFVMLLGKFFFSLCAWFVRMGEGYRSISNKIVVYEYWIVQSVIYYFSSLIFIIARLLYIINANHVFLWEHVLTWVHLGNYTNPICLLPVVRQGQLCELS